MDFNEDELFTSIETFEQTLFSNILTKDYGCVNIQRNK